MVIAILEILPEKQEERSTDLGGVETDAVHEDFTSYVELFAFLWYSTFSSVVVNSR